MTLQQTATPTDHDIRLADETSRFLERVSTVEHDVRLQLLDTDSPHASFSLPVSALRLLNKILQEMAKGNAVALLPVNANLTTQEAAGILNVSRPFIVRLLDAGKIPYQRYGSHRRIRLADLIAFKNKSDAERNEAFRQLTEEAQDLDMGY